MENINSLETTSIPPVEEIDDTPIAHLAWKPDLDEETRANLYKGAFERNTYDWFYDSLTEKERYEFIDLFVYRRLGRSYLLPDYVIRGDNYEFFCIFFDYIDVYYDKLSPTLLEKMCQYCINAYGAQF